MIYEVTYIRSLKKIISKKSKTSKEKEIISYNITTGTQTFKMPKYVSKTNLKKYRGLKKVDEICRAFFTFPKIRIRELNLGK